MLAGQHYLVFIQCKFATQHAYLLFNRLQNTREYSWKSFQAEEAEKERQAQELEKQREREALALAIPNGTADKLELERREREENE